MLPRIIKTILLLVSIILTCIFSARLNAQSQVFYDNAIISPGIPVPAILLNNQKAFTVRDEYYCGDKKQYKDSSLFKRTIYDSSGHVSAIGWYENNELIRFRTFFWSDDQLVEEQIESETAHISVNYIYDSKGDLVEEKKQEKHSYRKDSTSTVVRWEYDDENRPVRRIDVQSDGSSCTRKTFHYLNGKLFEEKVFDPKDGYIYSYFFTYGNNKITSFLKNLSGQRAVNEWKFDENGKMIQSKSIGFPESKTEYQYNSEGLLIKTIHSDYRNRKIYYNYYYNK